MHDAHIAAAATETARDSGKSQEVARQQTSKKQQLTVEGSHTAHDMVAESHGIEGNNEDEIMDDIRQATADDEADDDADKGDNDFVPLGHAAPSVKENSTETPGLSRTPPYQIQQGIESYKYSLLGQYFSEVGQKAHQGMVPSTIPICYRDLVNKMFEITDITTLMSHKKGILKDGETNTDAEEDSEREESIVDSPDQEEAEDEANDSQEKERSIQDNDEGDDSDSLDVSRERAAIDWALDGRVEE
ncbi:MAG: hypothetical protein M1831_000998 [Alyxoria varia]|nr:MAG: hypothetical protein M1831_000998 [Alyxoria varia]